MKKIDNEDKKVEKKKLKLNFDNKFFNAIKKKFAEYKKRLDFGNHKFNLLELVLLVIISFIFGIFISEAFVFQKGNTNSGGSFPTIIISNNNSNEIEKTYKTILEKYYEDIDEEELKEAAINGMLNYLGDNYSMYFDEEEKDDFEEELNGTYIGVGLKLTKYLEQYPVVTEVFENTPASESDFQVGDYLIKVAGNDVLDLELTDVVAQIKGELNRTVKVVIKRGEEELEKTITTKQVEIPTVYSDTFEVNDKKIGYLYISLFADNTDEQFKEELTKLEKAKIDSLIIDVRNNVGGHLSTVTNILNMFFDKDEVIYQKDKKGVIEKFYGKGTNKDYEVVVLVNQTSASASEILASAFKEISDSQIVGMKTFGKGTVQQTMNLSGGGMIKITTENWLTSKGNLIDGVGVEPTIEIELTEDYVNNPSDETDNQLQKAIEILKDK